MTKMTWFNLTNFGIVDLKIMCGEGTILRFKNSGSPTTPKTCGDGFSRLQALQEPGYGLTNARMTCVRGGTSEARSNKVGNWNNLLSCDTDYVIIGLNVRHGTGYGLVNVKILCGQYKVPGKSSIVV